MKQIITFILMCLVAIAATAQTEQPDSIKTQKT